MPKIVITEKDETSAGVFAESTDVVYIPGFVDITQSELYKDGEYVGLEPNKPTLFTTVTQFESKCGKRAPKFTKTQYYTDLIRPIAGTDDYTGFDNDAVPFHRVMFSEGAVDPSYVMAKEYLSAGLNVLYERVNNDYEFEKVEVEPKVEGKSIWADTYVDYYKEAVDPNDPDKVAIYTPITTGTPPLWYQEVLDEEPVNDEETYFTYKLTKNEGGEFELTSCTPTTFTKGSKYEKPKDTDNEKTMCCRKLADFYEVDYRELTGEEVGSFVWEANTYYLPIRDENGKDIYRLIEDHYEIQLAEKKTDKPNVAEFAKGYDGALEVKVYKCVTSDEDGNMKHISEIPNWYKDYVNCYERAEKEADDMNVNFMVRVNECATAPEFGATTYYKKVSCVNIVNMYNALEGLYDKDDKQRLSDRGNYSLKYLTSGGYPVYEYTANGIVNKMLDLAEERGDCVAIIDHTDRPDRQSNIDLPGSLYHTVSNDINTFGTNGEYGTMFTPWAEYNRTTVDKDKNNQIDKSSPTKMRFPASFAYFMALGDSIQTNANWLAIAGSARGVVPNLTPEGMTTNIPNGAADAMQPRTGISVNPITNIKPYGYTIWGNRTLKNNGENLIATSFLNIRNLISDVKKVAYRVARRLTFEQNSEVLWVNFKGLIAPTLDRMMSGYGISGYKIIRDTEHEKAQEKATICAKILLYPVYAVEDFYITIVLKDDEVSVD